MISDKLRSYIKAWTYLFKKIVKEASYKERKEFFIPIERNRKLKQILDF